MTGPPPKDASQRRRRNATPGFKLLPHDGRDGLAPEWPFATPTEDESRTWNKVWKLPQAIEWERMRCEDTVALYVRTFCCAVQSPDNTKLLAEVRQLDAKIGLSPKAMRDLRWETDEPRDEPEVEAASPASVPAAARTYVPQR